MSLTPRDHVLKVAGKHVPVGGSLVNLKTRKTGKKEKNERNCSEPPLKLGERGLIQPDNNASAKEMMISKFPLNAAVSASKTLTPCFLAVPRWVEDPEGRSRLGKRWQAI